MKLSHLLQFYAAVPQTHKASLARFLENLMQGKVTLHEIYLSMKKKRLHG